MAEEISRPHLWKSFLSAIKGSIFGAYYGFKTRVVHSIVISLLFKKGNLSHRAKDILRATWEHGSNLALFVFIQKLTMAIVGSTFNTFNTWAAFVGGVIGASVVWRKRTPVSSQLCFYMMS